MNVVFSLAQEFLSILLTNFWFVPAVSTCLAALGDSFAGGTTDGPGDFNFKQGVNDSSTNAWWNFIAHFLSSPSTEQIKCQYPKVTVISILLPWIFR